MSLPYIPLAESNTLRKKIRFKVPIVNKTHITHIHTHTLITLIPHRPVNSHDAHESSCHVKLCSFCPHAHGRDTICTAPTRRGRPLLSEACQMHMRRWAVLSPPATPDPDPALLRSPRCAPPQAPHPAPPAIYARTSPGLLFWRSTPTPPRPHRQQRPAILHVRAIETESARVSPPLLRPLVLLVLLALLDARRSPGSLQIGMAGAQKMMRVSRVSARMPACWIPGRERAV